MAYCEYRIHALHKHRTTTPHPTIRLPSEGMPFERPVVTGFALIINLYKLTDSDFVIVWNRVQGLADASWIVRLHAQLSTAVPAYFECTKVQVVEIHVTEQWLRSMVWQLCVRQGLVSNTSNDGPLKPTYPTQISKDFLATMHELSHLAKHVYGIITVSRIAQCSCAAFEPMFVMIQKIS